MIDVTSANIINIIASGETQTVEFKESFHDEAIETIGALSNAQGGIILIGVKDSGKICGIQIGKKTVEDIANKIQTVTDPRIQPSLSIVNLDEKNILVITMIKNTGVPVSVRGRFFIRSGKTNQRMSHEEIMHRITASTGLSWDAVIEPRAKLDDLDFDLIDRFIISARELGRIPVPEQITREEFLRKLELIENKSPSRAALLLFGKNPESFFSSAFLKMGRFRSPIMIIDDREVHGPLITQLDGAMSWFKERLSTEFLIEGNLERDVIWEYPLSVIREALVNLLCHRDYTHGAHSQIRLYDDHLAFWNGGGLPPSLTPESLFKEHDSMPRNRKIAEAFFYIGLIEKWGSGTLRIIDGLRDAKYPEPEFISEAGRFRLILYKKTGIQKQISQDDCLTDRQNKILIILKEGGKSQNKILNLLDENITDRTLRRDLNALKEKKYILTKGSTWQSKWFIV